MTSAYSTIYFIFLPAFILFTIFLSHETCNNIANIKKTWLRLLKYIMQWFHLMTQIILVIVTVISYFGNKIAIQLISLPAILANYSFMTICDIVSLEYLAILKQINKNTSTINITYYITNTFLFFKNLLSYSAGLSLAITSLTTNLDSSQRKITAIIAFIFLAISMCVTIILLAIAHFVFGELLRDSMRKHDKESETFKTIRKVLTNLIVHVIFLSIGAVFGVIFNAISLTLFILDYPSSIATAILKPFQTSWYIYAQTIIFIILAIYPRMKKCF